MKHWAYDLIGARWELGADGPDTFDCRGLVRHVYRERRGCDIPQLVEGYAHGDMSVALHDALAEGWELVGRRFSFYPKDLDLVFMRSAGGFHVGVMIAVDTGFRLLHSVGAMVDGRATGEVLSQPLADAPSLGFGRPEFWRKHAV